MNSVFIVLHTPRQRCQSFSTVLYPFSDVLTPSSLFSNPPTAKWKFSKRDCAPLPWRRPAAEKVSAVSVKGGLKEGVSRGGFVRLVGAVGTTYLTLSRRHTCSD